MAKEFNYRDYLKNNPLLTEDQGYDDKLDDSLGMKNGKKKQDMKQRRADSENMEKAKDKRKYSGDKSMDEEMDMKKTKMSVKELKASIRERILSEMEDDLDEASAVNWEKRNSPAGDSLDLAPRKVGTSTVEEKNNYYEEDDITNEAEEIDIDVEDDINIDDVSDKSEIEVDSELAGKSADVAAILGLLTKAQEEAKSLGDDKLLDQIGNTITYYTRAHVVASTNEPK